MTCWQCGAAPGGPVCCACGVLQPPDPRLDHFTRLGLECRFDQDPEEVARRHRALQRKVHPDLFAHRGAYERRLSLEHATALNDAVRALRGGQRRADYLLKLRGVDLDDESRAPVALDSGFLMEVIELREALAELTGPDAQTERARLAREVVARYESTLAELGKGLDEGERPVAELAELAARLRYLRRAIDELEQDA